MPLGYKSKITTHPETPVDIPAIFEVNTLAFGQVNEARLVDEIRRSPGFIPELSLVAVNDDLVIGHILFSKITIESDTSVFPALALAPMAVRPEYQRTGVGSQLVHTGLDRARSLAHRIVVVVGHPAYYPRFGFVPARAMGIEMPLPVPDDAFLVLELTNGALLGVHGTVRYPSPFGAI